MKHHYFYVNLGMSQVKALLTVLKGRGLLSGVLLYSDQREA